MSGGSGDNAESARVFACNSWREFREKLLDREDKIAHIFRGHAKRSWKLSSKFERLVGQLIPLVAQGSQDEFDVKYTEEFARTFLSRFKHSALGLNAIRSHEMSEDEWYALGRHFGLVTPLLDWTESPFVAAFFAIADRIRMVEKAREQTPKEWGSEPMAVWAIRCDEARLSTLKGFRRISGWSDSAFRQRAQRGLFTRIESGSCLDLVSFFAQQGALDLLTCYELSTHTIADGMFDLWDMNIRYDSLFPDLHGAAMQGNCPDFRTDYNASLDIMIPLSILREREISQLLGTFAIPNEANQ